MQKEELKIGLYCQQARDVRVINIILTHWKSALYRFRVVSGDSNEDVAIAITDVCDSAMRQRSAAARQRQPTLALVNLVNQAGQADGHNEILPGQLTSHLVSTLERLAQQHLAQAGAPGQAARGNVVQLLTPTAPAPRLRALVVDDSPTVRTQLANVVERIGMQCDTADSAKSALAVLAGQVYDMIYVDVVMPDMDGYKLTREIKRDRRHKATPVIILTSKSSPFDRARGALAGCDLYLTKPVGLRAFYDASCKALRKALAIDELDGRLIDPSLAARTPRAATPAPAPLPAPPRAAPALLRPLATAMPTAMPTPKLMTPPTVLPHPPGPDAWQATLPAELSHLNGR